MCLCIFGFVRFYICVFVYLGVCVFLGLCVSVFVYLCVGAFVYMCVGVFVEQYSILFGRSLFLRLSKSSLNKENCSNVKKCREGRPSGAAVIHEKKQSFWR